MSHQCKKFSNEAINAIQQVNLNILLICNVCVSQNKRDVVNDRLKDKQEKLADTKESLKTVIEETMQNKIKETKLTKTSYKEALENQSNESFKQVSNPKIELNVLLRGIDELNDEGLRVEHDGAETNNVFSFLDINTKFTDLKRVSKYKPENHCPLLVTMPSVFDKKLLLSSPARLKNFYKQIYKNREHRRSEAQKTNSGGTVESNKIFSSAHIGSDLDHLGPKGLGGFCTILKKEHLKGITCTLWKVIDEDIWN